ncbi:MAG: hypothetical protein EBR09_03840 [Proteobacteria bacterium]|nr:hypothetical protein [Pseudomonadota bacterium]
MRLKPLFRLTPLFSVFILLKPYPARADLESTVSTSLDSENHSSLLSLDADRKLETVQLDADLSGEISAPYKNLLKYADSTTAKLSLTLLKGISPSLGLLATTSNSDKTTTLGSFGGVSLQNKLLGHTVSWSPSLSLNRTTFKLNTQAGKIPKRPNPFLIQYGLSQSLKIARSQDDFLTLYYNYYGYNRDLEALNNLTVTPSKFSKQKANAATIAEKISIYAQSLAGIAINYSPVSDFEIEGEFYRTILKKDQSQSNLLTLDLTYALTEETDVSLQADLVRSSSNSNTLTLSVPHQWTETFISEIGVARTATADSTGLSLLLSLKYQDESGSTKAGSRNR